MRRGFLAVALPVAVAACGAAQPVAADAPREPGRVIEQFVTDDEMTIAQWRDPTSGCRYIVARFDGYKAGGIAITPALNRSGTPDCGVAR